MPDRAAIAMSSGRLAAGVAHSVFRVRRKVVTDQIRRSFPERDPGWVRRTARECYRHFGTEFGLLAGGPAAVDQALATVRDPGPANEVLTRLGGGSPGVVIVTGHIGNWELAGSYLASAGVPVTAVARRQSGSFGSMLSRLRERIGMEIVDQHAGVRPLFRALRAGRCVALVADQHSGSGERIPFMGRLARWRLGPARLAISAGVPLVFGSMVRDAEGYLLELRPIAREALAVGDPVTATRAWVSILEEAVRERPAQYFWFHRRWKS